MKAKTIDAGSGDIPLTEEQSRARAKAIYMTMRVPRFTTIAERAGAAVSQVHTWAKEENWLAQRALHLESEKRKLYKRLGSPRRHPMIIYRYIDGMLRSMTKKAKDGGFQGYGHEFQDSASLLKELYALSKQCRQELGMTDTPKRN